jgi:hypothetical protein
MGDDYSETGDAYSASVCRENTRREAARREAERNAEWAARQAAASEMLKRRNPPVHRDALSAQASVGAQAIADAIRRDRSPEGVVRRARERADRERELRESAIADAIERAQRPQDPRSSAERLAGYNRHVEET